MRILFISALLLFSIVLNSQTVGIFQNTTESLNGYTLIAPLLATDIYLIDNCGEVVNSWTNSNYKPGAIVHLLDDGSLLKTCKLSSGSMIAGGSGGRLEQYSWGDTLIWAYDIDSPTHRQHHDVTVLPN